MAVIWVFACQSDIHNICMMLRAPVVLVHMWTGTVRQCVPYLMTVFLLEMHGKLDGELPCASLASAPPCVGS